MKSFLKEIEDKFLDLESAESCNECGYTMSECMCEQDLDEISTTGGVAGYNTPNAFSKHGADDDTVETLGYKRVNESTHNLEKYQRPEFPEAEYMEKFAYATDGETWQHEEYEYPSKDLSQLPGQSKRKDITIQHKLGEMIDSKYEQIIEGYRSFANGDPKKTPERKVKETIQEIAKKLQEIETMVNYNSRLKTESGVTSNAYGPSTKKALTKISERLIKISERVRSLGE